MILLVLLPVSLATNALSAVGCIFGELLQHSPLFPAKDEVECLHMHAGLLGTPTPYIWPVSRDSKDMEGRGRQMIDLG